MIRQRSFDRSLHGPVSPLTPATPGTRNSQASSFQSVSSDDASVMADVGHFEDIGLDDDKGHGTLNPPAAPMARRLSPSPSPASESRRSLTGGHPPPSRSLAASSSSSNRPRPRRSFPNLHSNLRMSDPRSTSLSVLSDPRPVSPSGSRPRPNQSTPSLALTDRRRSPSPAHSLNPRDPNLPAKFRRGSWQTSHDRKSLGQLDQQYDEEDEDDDIPSGMVLSNVPLSPRPMQERPRSRTSSRAPSASASPDRSPKERVRSVGNGTPAVAQAQGSLRSPSWKSEANGTPRSPFGPYKGRSLSWNAAHSELSAETKALTEKLEEHADEVEQREEEASQRMRRPSGSGRPNTWNASRRSVDNIYDKKERVKSTPELPPLRRSNVMIDPLPVSKEKEAVLSRTRPSWLPPKDPAEEKKHLRQYQKMMAASVKADERREAARRVKSESRDVVADSMMSLWEKDIIPRWQDAIRETRTRDLWWRGVPPRSRGAVWSRALGNELGLTENSYRAALSRAKDLQALVESGQGDSEDVRRSKWFEQARSDVGNSTWTDLKIFQDGGPLHERLVDVLSAYAMYRNDIGYVYGYSTIGALLLLNLADPALTFVALANVLNRPLPLSFYASDMGAQASAYNLVLRTLRNKSPKLYDHLMSHTADIDPGFYLGDLFLSIFTRHLPIDSASRLWDVYVFEGDGILVKAAVALLLRKEMELLGTNSAEGMRDVLYGSAAKTPPVEQAGAEDAFMKLVRESGKVPH